MKKRVRWLMRNKTDMREVISVSMEKVLLDRLDNFVQSHEFKPTRTAVIVGVLEKFLNTYEKKSAPTEKK